MPESILSRHAPAPAGHYSQAIVHAGLVYVAGQVSIDPATGKAKPGSIEEQTEQTLRNIDAILTAAGSNRNRVLKTTVYLAKIEDWARMNAAYAKFFGNHRPARAAFGVTLPPDYLVEIEVVAAVGE
jgi:2-iminobutanoate/2-iminopropanoate deaminase